MTNNCPAKSRRRSRIFPAAPRWTAIEVPGDKNQRDDLVFAHRLWYRTRVNVPTSLAGRSLFLVFPANNLNTTIYVNGQFCGFDKNPFARLQFDVTKAVRPGVNEIRVGIKDAWYGYLADPADPLKLRRRWNLPLQFFSNGFQELVYPIWNQTRMGIVGTPQWIVAGPVYTADVFCKPSVANKKLAVEIAIQNNRSDSRQARCLLEAVNDQIGRSGEELDAAAGGRSSGGQAVLDRELIGRIQNSGGRTSRTAIGCGPRCRLTASRWTCRRRCSVSGNGRATGSFCG